MTTRVRKSNRLQNYDYFQAGYYFVTICTQNRKELFGEIVDSQMVTNTAGEMVIKTWNELPKFYHGIQMDQFQIMPNHVHGIIVIVGDGPRAVPNEPRALPDGQPQGVVPTLSLSNVVHRFKTLATRYTSKASTKRVGNHSMPNCGNAPFTIISSGMNNP